ncbi:MAG: S41 family peptidase [Bacteroidales bacterium]|nr:S41 family peptidase [Bacteroidales bacterium]
MKRIFAIFITICVSTIVFAQKNGLEQNTKKMARMMWLIENYYVDTTNISHLTEEGLKTMLKDLDPHSVYIPTSDVQKMNEPLQGNIIGIGVTFQLLNDTIHVMEVVADGPAEKVGILPGDRIVKVNDTLAVGDSINNDWVMKHLRGKKGSKVKVGIQRSGRGELSFDIIRDKIPLNSVDTYFMIDKEIGYISLRRYAQASRDEVVAAIDSLKKQGMKKLIFDLRSNGGGYLETAFKICDEFLPKDKLVVYTEGIHQQRQEFTTLSNNGAWEKGELVILTDEYTASASEITSGAIQDWDRGVIIGRRTFGKGLVQRPFNFDDRSQVRLTIARYYIPSGRCIQKPYEDGTDEYFKDYAKRLSHGEMIYADSISFPDSLKYKTYKGRTVYGGGGIMPDIFVPMDTSRASDYYINLRSKNLFNDFSINYAEQNREELLKKYPTFESFNAAWKDLNLIKEFEQYALEKGVVRSEIKKDWVNAMFEDYLKDLKQDSSMTYQDYTSYAKAIFENAEMRKTIMEKAQKEDVKSKEIIENSDKHIDSVLKGFIARNLYGTKYYYMSVQQNDETLQKAVEVLKNNSLYKSLLKK